MPHLSSMVAVTRMRCHNTAIEDLRAARPDVVFVLRWDIVDEGIWLLEVDRGWGAEYVIPLQMPNAIT
jgi:hypothetical protein